MNYVAEVIFLDSPIYVAEVLLGDSPIAEVQFLPPQQILSVEFIYGQGPPGLNGTGFNDFVQNETPTGDVDGMNTIFTTANNFLAIAVYNGLRQKPSLDYNVTGANEITFTSPPTIGSTIVVDYFKS